MKLATDCGLFGCQAPAVYCNDSLVTIVEQVLLTGVSERCLTELIVNRVKPCSTKYIIIVLPTMISVFMTSTRVSYYVMYVHYNFALIINCQLNYNCGQPNEYV